MRNLKTDFLPSHLLAQFTVLQNLEAALSPYHAFRKIKELFFFFNLASETSNILIGELQKYL